MKSVRRSLPPKGELDGPLGNVDPVDLLARRIVDVHNTYGGKMMKPMTQIAVSNTAGNHTASATL